MIDDPGADEPSGHDADTVSHRVGDVGCTILHVDMDAFYASVAVRDHPQLRGRPVIVAAAGHRGVVLSATYEARAYGVRSAMPIAQAHRLCPSAVIVPPAHAAYAQASGQVMDILRSFTPLVEPLSLDEAFLDVAGARRLLGSPRFIGEQIRAAVREQTGLTCSVGVAGSKLLAKLATNAGKPDGLTVIPPADVAQFLHPLDVTALWGIGARTAHRLGELGVRTVADLIEVPLTTLERAFGANQAHRLAALARGEDPRPVVSDVPDRSFGAEHTFDEDVLDSERLTAMLLALCERTAARLRRAAVRGRTVVVKVRRADLVTLTRSRTLDHPTDRGQELYAAARGLYAGLRWERARIRLIGLRVSGLVSSAEATEQLTLGQADRGWREVDVARDRAVARFGEDAVTPARLLGGTHSARSGPHSGGLPVKPPQHPTPHGAGPPPGAPG